MEGALQVVQKPQLENPNNESPPEYVTVGRFRSELANQLDTCSIVIIPTVVGLAPTRTQAITASWLHTLREEFSSSWIVTFSYSSVTPPAIDGISAVADSSWLCLLDRANDLLFELLALRERRRTRRPIIFLCSSYGSFILKKVSFS